MNTKLKVFLKDKVFEVPNNSLAEAIRRWEKTRCAIASVRGCTFRVSPQATWLPFFSTLDGLLAKAASSNDKYPHICPGCGSPAYEGAYTLECLAECGLLKRED